MSEENAILDPVAVLEQDKEELPSAEEVADVGECLRLAREARGISINDAATALKLSPHQVVAMEAGDWFQWPRTVTRGFVRNYARYLGLDAGPLMKALDHAPMPQGPELAVGADSSIDMPHERQRDRRDYVRVVAGIIVLVLALLACFFVPTETWQATIDSAKAFLSDKEVTTEPVIEPLDAAGEVSGVIEIVPEGGIDSARVSSEPAVPAPFATASSEPPPIVAVPSEPATPIPIPIAAVSPEPAIPIPIPVAAVPSEPTPIAAMPPEPTAPSPATAESTAPSPSGAVLAFSFAQPSWVEVRDRAGQIVLSQINPAGSQREVVGQPPFALVVGNASYVTLQYQGKSVDLSPRSRDDVARLTLE